MSIYNIILSCILFLFCISSGFSSDQKEVKYSSVEQIEEAFSDFRKEVIQNNNYNETEVFAMLHSSLQIPDTTLFYEISKSIIFNYHYDQKLYVEAIDFVHKCQELLQNKDTPYGEYNNVLAMVYRRLGFQKETVEYFFKSLSWYEKYDEENITIPLGNIADIYFETNNLEKALEYNKLALSYSLKIESERDKLYNIVYDYIRLGQIYFKLDDIPASKSYFDKSLQAARQLDEKDVLIHSLSQVIDFYSKIGNIIKCEEWINEGKKIVNHEMFTNSRESSLFWLMINNHYLKNNLVDKATDPEELKIKLANITTQEESFNQYASKYYLLKNDVEKANEHLTKIIEIKNKKQQQRDSTTLESLEEQYQTNKLIEENKELSSKIERKRNTVNLILLGSLLLLGLIFMQQYNNSKTKKLNTLLQLKQEDLQKSNRKLENTNRKLEMSNTELERFVFIASHDLKTPLQNIINFTGLLDNHNNINNDKEAKEYLKHIKEGGQRLNDLIADTLEYSRISQSDRETIKETFDLNQLIQQVKNEMSPYIEERNAKIDIPVDLPIINAHPNSIAVLFRNLIENAIKYNSATTPEVKIEKRIEGENLVISITDNGIGIPKEHQENVFKMFTRLHNHSKYEGTGLGLSTCKKIMDFHNGAINIKSSDTNHTTFELSFPNEIIVST